MEKRLDSISQRLDDLTSKVEQLTSIINQLIQPQEPSFKGVLVRVMTEPVEGDWWDYESIIEVPDRAPIRIGCTVSDSAVEHALLSGIYAGLQQCWMHPASSKGLKIILENAEMVSLLKERKTLSKPPFENKKLSEQFFAIAGLLEALPSVEIELKS